jgi:Rab GDP dissociation inhibitor
LHLHPGPPDPGHGKPALCADHPPPAAAEEKERYLPAHSDIYIMMVSSVHCISKKDYYVAIISTTVETNNPNQEIEVALDLIGKIKEKFVTISERYVPTTKSTDGLFISESFDATSHFENETENVLRLYTEITGKELDLENLPEDNDE